MMSERNQPDSCRGWNYMAATRKNLSSLPQSPLPACPFEAVRRHDRLVVLAVGFAELQKSADFSDNINRRDQ